MVDTKKSPLPDLVGVTHFNIEFNANKAARMPFDENILDEWPNISHIYDKKTKEVLWKSPVKRSNN